MGKRGQKKQRALDRKAARRRAIDTRLVNARKNAKADAESLIELFNATLAWRQAVYSGDYREHVQNAFRNTFAPQDRVGLRPVVDAGTAHELIRDVVAAKQARDLAELLQ